MTRDLINPPGRGGIIAGLGDTGIDAGDVALPRVVLTQGLSTAVSAGDAPVGVFYNNLTDKVVGKAFDFVPIVAFRNRVRLVLGAGLVCRSLDMVQGQGNPGIACDDCALKDWPNDDTGKGPACGVSHNWFGLIVGAPHWEGSGKKQETLTVEPLEEPQIAIVQWRSMATKTAKKWRGLHLNASLTKPNSQWWDRVYRVGCKQETNDKGTYYVPTITLVGPSSSEHRGFAQNAMTVLTGSQLAWEPTGEEPDETVDAAEPVAAAEF